MAKVTKSIGSDDFSLLKLTRKIKNEVKQSRLMTKEQVMFKTTMIKVNLLAMKSDYKELEFYIQEGNNEKFIQKFNHLRTSPNMISPSGDSLLQAAVKFGNIEAVQFLLERNAEVNHKNVQD